MRARTALMGVILAAACVLGINPLQAQQADSAQAFVSKLFNPYFQGHLSVLSGDPATYIPQAERQLFDASTYKLWLKATRANADGPIFDGDVICDCQEAEISDLRINVETANRRQAVVDTFFSNEGKPNKVVFKLAKVGQDWRIHDIVYSGGTLRHQLGAGNEGAGATPAVAAPAKGQMPFPGIGALPRQVRDSMDLVRLLYAGRSFRAESCGPQACSVRLVADRMFQDANGIKHLLLVTAAEPPDDFASHASGALMGMALLKSSEKGWTLELGSPAVDTQGTFGKSPDVVIIPAGYWGSAIVMQPTYFGQGIADKSWELYVPDLKEGKFKHALSIPMEHESSDSCEHPTAECLHDDFSTRIQVIAGRGGSLVVEAPTSYPATLHKSPLTKAFEVLPQ